MVTHPFLQILIYNWVADKMEAKFNYSGPISRKNVHSYAQINAWTYLLFIVTIYFDSSVKCPGCVISGFYKLK